MIVEFVLAETGTTVDINKDLVEKTEARGKDGGSTAVTLYTGETYIVLGSLEAVRRKLAGIIPYNDPTQFQR